jgi:6-phosphogluconolactonase (cycloisomerase 2 family)
VVADNGKTVYATNTGSNDITSLSVSGYGHLSLANGGASTPTNAGPIDAAMDKNSRNLYVLARGNSAIISYSVKSNGRLTQIDEDGGLPARASGLVVR